MSDERSSSGTVDAPPCDHSKLQDGQICPVCGCMGNGEALVGAALARWCYVNPNMAARTIEGLRGPDDELIGLNARLSDALIEIKQLRAELAKPKAEARCPHCGEVGDHDGYCGVC